MKTDYRMPANLSSNPAANLELFLLENLGTVCGEWTGRILAEDQRALMGRFLGRGRLVIDGYEERVLIIGTEGLGDDWGYDFADFGKDEADTDLDRSDIH